VGSTADLPTYPPPYYGYAGSPPGPCARRTKKGDGRLGNIIICGNHSEHAVPGNIFI